MQGSSRLRALAAAALGLLAASALAAATAGTVSGAAAPADRPNVIVFLTDDQDLQSLRQMPFVSSFPDWTRFTNGFVNYALCCPSRATILSGQYSHHDGVDRNEDSINFDEAHALPTWLHDAGYRTALFGKYFNDYPWDRGPSYIPPGWDRWSAFNSRARYYDYSLNVDGRTVPFGERPEEYSTNVLAAGALRFLADRGGDPNQPFFLYFAPYGPHIPRTPAPGDARSYKLRDMKLPGNFNERRDDDKPSWVRRLSRGHRYGSAKKAKAALRAQADTLLSVDRSAAAMFRQLEAQGELDDTVIFFLSDNGFSYGSHGWKGKVCMYEECNHVPYLVYDPLHNPAGSRVETLVSNTDIAPTVAELAGASPTHPLDGRSLLPLIEGRPLDHGRAGILFRAAGGGAFDPGWGIRTSRYSYLIDQPERGGRQLELYDMARDPLQLRNLLQRHRRAHGAVPPRYRTVAKRLNRALQRTRGPR
jgi:arylsulfatase A-like enzyme